MAFQKLTKILAKKLNHRPRLRDCDVISYMFALAQSLSNIMLRVIRSENIVAVIHIRFNKHPLIMSADVTGASKPFVSVHLIRISFDEDCTIMHLFSHG